MPEYRECIAHFLFLLWFLRYCQQKGLDLHVLGLWTDKTAGKKGKKPKPTDLVFMLDHNSKDKRGNAGNQGYLWPPMWRKSSENPNPPSISLLELQGVRTTSRAIILNFGALHFQLAYLTHTSVQCFNKHTWDTVIRKTPIATRGYRIALAIEFSDYVMAFLSIDQLIQPLWVVNENELPSPPTDVYSSYPNFLAEVAQWIRDRSTLNRSSYACEVIRKQGRVVFGGVGVYTICELFFDAGLSPFLTEAEVFNCPSRTARLCDAFWAYAHKSHNELQDLLASATVDGIIAPTREQRERYSSWLHIYGKQSAKITIRMADILDVYQRIIEAHDASEVWYRDSITGPGWPDVFEPDLIRVALTDTSKVTLGHLIFGEEQWKAFGQSIPQQDDPLTSLYHELELFGGDTHLARYNTLFSNEDQRTRKIKQSYTYRINDNKQVWSLTKAFPDNCYAHKDATSDPPVQEVIGKKRHDMLFKTIVNSQKDVAIGPLEYCGNGTVIRTTHRQKKASAVRASREEILSQPSTSEHTRFRLGYFSPQKRSKSSVSSSSWASDSDRILLGENTPAEEGSQSSDSDSFPVERWNSPLPDLSMGNDQGEDPDLPLTVPSSPSLLSTDYTSSSEAPSEFDAQLPASPPRKKKKTRHISADKALVLGGDAQQHDDAGPSSSTSRATRQRKEVNYARVKRKYTKQQ